MSTEWKVGERVDVFKNNLKHWQIEQIVKIDKEKQQIVTESLFKVKDTISMASEDDKKRLAKINTNTVGITTLKSDIVDESNAIYLYHTNVIYDTKTNSIIMINRSNNLIKYDVKTNTYSKLLSLLLDNIYDTKIGLNEAKRLIYILNRKSMMVINADNFELMHEHEVKSKFEVDFDSFSNYDSDDSQFDENKYRGCCCSIYIPHPINQYNLFTDIHKHYVLPFNVNNKPQTLIQFQDEFEDESSRLMWPDKILYVKSLNKLFSFGGQDNGEHIVSDIYYIDVGNGRTNYEWIKYSIDLPVWDFDNVQFDFVLGFNHIIFLFYNIDKVVLLGNELDHDMIYVLDLKYHQIYPFTTLHLGYLEQFVVVKDKYNDCHVITDKGDMERWIFDDNYNKDYHHIHYKFSLYDIIPKEMVTFYQRVYNPLIYGYIKEMQNKLQLTLDFPVCLIETILYYFPSFL